MKNNTCIVAFIDKKGTLWMGGDSAGVSGLNIRIRTDEKVFYRGNFLIGYTSSFRMGQLLRFNLNVSIQKDGQSDYEFMCTDFIEAVRKCLKDGGYSKVEDNQEEIGTFLVGYKRKIYSIHEDLQVGTVKDNFDACGCGESYALGVLKNSDTNDGEKAIRKALETSEYFSGGVRSPFIILKQD